VLVFLFTFICCDEADREYFTQQFTMDSITEEAPVSESTTDTTEETPNNTRASRIHFRWKGKIVKESMYKRRLAQQEAAKKRKLESLTKNDEPKIPVEGRRIVDFSLLAKHLVCDSCKETLSLRDIATETRRGLASILHVRCRGCSEVTCVPTSKQVTDKNTKSRFYTVNRDIVNGAIQAGIPCTRLNKLLVSLDIPQLQWKLFQRYKHELTASAEADKGATNNFSVDDALEKAETVQNTEDIQKMLEDIF